MAAVTTVPSFFLLRTRIQGCVMGIKYIKLSKRKGFFRTFLTVLAQDEDALPHIFVVNGSYPLGKCGQDVDVICQIRPINVMGYYNIQLWLDE